jgi:hypothetical protein
MVPVRKYLSSLFQTNFSPIFSSLLSREQFSHDYFPWFLARARLRPILRISSPVTVEAPL